MFVFTVVVHHPPSHITRECITSLLESARTFVFFLFFFVLFFKYLINRDCHLIDSCPSTKVYLCLPPPPFWMGKIVWPLSLQSQRLAHPPSVFNSNVYMYIISQRYSLVVVVVVEFSCWREIENCRGKKMNERHDTVMVVALISFKFHLINRRVGGICIICPLHYTRTVCALTGPSLFFLWGSFFFLFFFFKICVRQFMLCLMCAI